MKTITYGDTKFVLVPIEPTEEMYFAFSDKYRTDFDTAYQEMLNAAPKAERRVPDEGLIIPPKASSEAAERPDHRAVMEQALEALENARLFFEAERKTISKGNGSQWSMWQCQEQMEALEPAITALRNALKGEV